MIKKGKFLIGTSGWTFSDWRGVFYPQDLPAKKWLEYYAKHFATVEMNATFYRHFDKEIYAKWRKAVPKQFRFVVKVSGLITHRAYLINCEELIKQFCKDVYALQDKLGLILLQIAPRTAYDPDRLRKALLAFKDPKKVVVEFRDEKWFTPEIKKLLKETGSVFCATDSPKIKLLDWLTSKTAYIRLHGRTRWYDYNYTKKTLEEIASFAKHLQKKGAKTIYIFFNNDYYGYAVKNAFYLQELLQ